MKPLRDSSSAAWEQRGRNDNTIFKKESKPNGRGGKRSASALKTKNGAKMKYFPLALVVIVEIAATIVLYYLKILSDPFALLIAAFIVFITIEEWPCQKRPVVKTRRKKPSAQAADERK